MGGWEGGGGWSGEGERGRGQGGMERGSMNTNSRLSKEAQREEARCNYERYRALVQNAYHKVGEGAALSKIAVEEEFADPPGQKKVKKKNKYADALS